MLLRTVLILCIGAVLSVERDPGKIDREKFNINTNNPAFTFYEAVIGGKFDEVQQFLTNESAPITSEQKNIALHLAASQGHEKIAEALLKSGADVNNKEDPSILPLTRAVFWGHDRVAELLIKNGANPNLEVPTHSGFYNPILYIAAEEGHDKVVEVLVKAGADVNSTSTTQRERTALHVAAEQGNNKVIEILIRNGANVNSVDGYNRTPLDYAAGSGFDKTVELLLKNEAGMYPSALGEAASKGRDKVVELLIKAGADVNAMDKNNRTALHKAASIDMDSVTAAFFDKLITDPKLKKKIHTSMDPEGKLKAAKLLIENGANVNSVDWSMSTPLHYAVIYGQVEIVKLLMEHGASIDQQDKNGDTASSLAAEKSPIFADILSGKFKSTDN